MTRIRRLLRVLVYGLSVFVLLLLIAAALERVVWRGKVLPGVHLIGAAVAGESVDRATDEVAAAATRLATESVTFDAGGERLVLDPRDIDLEVDPEATTAALSDAGRTGNPLDQIVGTLLRLTGSEDVMWKISYDADALATVLEGWESAVKVQAVDGTLEFDGSTVRPVPPEAGRVLDRPAADQAVVAALQSGERGVIDLPVRTRRPTITRADVDRAAAEARTLLASAVTVRIEGQSFRLSPSQVASVLRPTVEDSTLELTVDHEVLREELGEDAAALEGPPENAHFEVDGTVAIVVPHRVGKQLDLEQIATGILRGDRIVEGRMTEKQPDKTSEDLEALRIEELVATFTSKYPAGQARVTNIHRASEIVDGTIIPAGSTFSLNEALGKRTSDRGFVNAPVIYGGEYTEDIGGGTSQFATAFFNAIFFGGYPIVEYQAHTFYISRYPMGREATLSWPSPDLRFRNDTDAAILVRASVTASSVTVSFYSEKIREVEAEGPVVVETIPIPEEFEADPAIERGAQNVRESGSEGRIVRVTRVTRNLDGEELSRKTFTTRYRPEKRIVAVHPCDHPDEAERPPPEECVEEPPPGEGEPPPGEGEPPGEATTTTVPPDAGDP